MNALERVREHVRSALPRAHVDLDQPDNPLGTWWLDAVHRGRRVTVEWRPRRGFGVSAREAEYGEGSDETYEDEELTAARVVDLLKSGEKTKEPEALPLQAIRENLGISQARVAKAIGASQVAVSRIEGRRDVLLSTLRRYTKAIGGVLEVKIRVGDRAVNLDWPDREEAPAVRRAPRNRPAPRTKSRTRRGGRKKGK